MTDERVTPGDRHDRVEVARLSGEVHRDERLGPRRDRRLDARRVDVERVGLDVDEHRPRARDAR